jgi:hypothetical protein
MDSSVRTPFARRSRTRAFYRARACRIGLAEKSGRVVCADVSSRCCGNCHMMSGSCPCARRSRIWRRAWRRCHTSLSTLCSPRKFCTMCPGLNGLTFSGAWLACWWAAACRDAAAGHRLSVVRRRAPSLRAPPDGPCPCGGCLRGGRGNCRGDVWLVHLTLPQDRWLGPVDRVDYLAGLPGRLARHPRPSSDRAFGAQRPMLDLAPM